MTSPRDQLKELADRVEAIAPFEKWALPSTDEIAGYWGSGSEIFVFERPSKSNSAQLGRLYRFYALLSEYGLAGAHLTDLVKRPAPSGTKISEAEIDESWPFLREEVEIIRPRVIVAMGKAVFSAIGKRLDVLVPSVLFTHYAYRYKAQEQLDEVFRRDFVRLVAALNREEQA